MKLFKKFLPGLKQILNHFCKRVKAANERAAFIEQRVNEMRSQNAREVFSLGRWVAPMSRLEILKNLRLELSRLMGYLSTKEILSNEKLICQLEAVVGEILVLSEQGE